MVLRLWWVRVRDSLWAVPGGITAALATTVRSGDRLYHPQPWGSWFEFALPQVTVAVDSRFELFPDAVWADYDAAQEASR